MAVEQQTGPNGKPGWYGAFDKNGEFWDLIDIQRAEQWVIWIYFNKERAEDIAIVFDEIED